MADARGAWWRALRVQRRSPDPPAAALELAHDYDPRRVHLSPAQLLELAPLAFTVRPDGGADLIVRPNFGPCYVATLPADVAGALLPVLEQAARALLPLVAADGDLGPLSGLVDREQGAA